MRLFYETLGVITGHYRFSSDWGLQLLIKWFLFKISETIRTFNIYQTSASPFGILFTLFFFNLQITCVLSIFASDWISSLLFLLLSMTMLFFYARTLIMLLIVCLNIIIQVSHWLWKLRVIMWNLGLCMLLDRWEGAILNPAIISDLTLRRLDTSGLP